MRFIKLVGHGAAHDGEAGGQENVTKGKTSLDFRDFSAGNREKIAIEMAPTSRSKFVRFSRRAPYVVCPNSTQRKCDTVRSCFRAVPDHVGARRATRRRLFCRMIVIPIWDRIGFPLRIPAKACFGSVRGKRASFRKSHIRPSRHASVRLCTLPMQIR